MNAGTERVLTGAQVRALSARSDLRGAVHAGLHAVAIVGAGYLVLVSNAWTILPAMLLLGILQSALFAPIHETMHLTAFASRRANAAVGWIAAAPSFLNWHFYAPFHLAHHRFTQDPLSDPELSPMPPATFDGYLMRIFALPYWRMRALVLLACWRGDLTPFPYLPPASHARIIQSVRAMSAVMVGGALLSAVLIGWWAPFAFWIVPQILGQPFLRLYLLAEHTGCTHDRNGLTNTRTVLTNPVMRWLMWNMPFHTEHHLYPSIPFHRLPAAHRAMRERLAVLQPGYARWHAGFVRSLRSNA